MSSPACVLVTGGAGFVGSHSCKALARAGFVPIVYDDLSNGHKEAVRWGPLQIGSMRDEARLVETLRHHNCVAVLHFAAYIEAGQSMIEPERFYENNVAGTLTLLRAMRRVGIKALVFSSTAAVYGEPEVTPIPETHPLQPVNPYGRSKLMVETILNDLARAEGLQFTALRYFNAAGADPTGELGENHHPETHLIPLILQAALGLREQITVYGTDYDTPDGTCLRDYVHVSDLADAHILALQRLLAGGDPLTANLGTGQGFSVRQVIEATRQSVGRDFPVKEAGRRAGDPAVLVANADLARTALHWRPQYTDLETMVRHAALRMTPQ